MSGLGMHSCIYNTCTNNMDVEEVRQIQWVGSEGFVNLGGGMVGIPCLHITRDPRMPNQQRVAAANPYAAATMDGTWTPKTKANTRVGPAQQYQRTPDDTVDNVTFCFKTDGSMEEPVLVLGEFNKSCNLSGQVQRVHGLCLAAGGHYERMGQRPASFSEAGDVDLLVAASKELEEEIGITEDGIVASQYVGFIDDPNNDPRKHVIRHIILRHVDVDPSQSEELANLVCVPLSKVVPLLNGKFRVRLNGEALGMVLNHDKVIRLVLSTPAGRQFVESMQRLQRPQGLREPPVVDSLAYLGGGNA